MIQQNRQLQKLGFVILAVALRLMCFAAYTIASSWHIRVPSAKIKINGKPAALYMTNQSPTVTELYRRRDGQLIIVLNQKQGLVYTVSADRQSVFFSNSERFRFRLGCAWNKDGINSYGPSLGYVDGIKAGSIRPDTNATLIVRDKHIEFNGLEMERIVVNW